MKLYGTFAHLARFIYSLFKPYKICGKLPFAPSVFIVHHQNMSGPVHALLTLPIQAHIWVYRVFFEKDECYRQYTDYTFTKRFGMPKFLACPLAFIMSLAVPAIMRSFSAIPVYRASRNILKTFKLSHKALVAGESIIIAPDIDYDDDSRLMGEMYTGFFHLEKNYYKETGKHLSFVPVSFATKEHTLYIGDAISFDDSTPYNEQKDKIAQKIKNAINQINKN